MLWIVTWLPLLLLTGIQDAILTDGSLRAFLADYAVQARLLVAAPMLILAEIVCLPRISAIAHHFLQSGLVPAEEAGAFHQICRSILRFYGSRRLEALIAGFAITFAAVLIYTAPPGFFPIWQYLQSGRTSPAGWWHTLVSVPILVTLLLGWAWRLLLWTRFLYRVSRLKLRLIAAHPDRAAGLRFVGISTSTFSFLAFALGVIVAGTVANRVVHDGAALLSFRWVLLCFDVICLLLFVSPLLVFTPTLMKVWRQGTRSYGALARDVGENFERKWLHRPAGEDALGVGDFSATTDLYAIAANVYAIAFVPVGWGSLLVVLVGATLPFIPVVLLAVSPQVLMQMLVERLF
jgi:hypothetical protein